MKKKFKIVTLLIFIIFNELLIIKIAKACHGYSTEKRVHTYNYNEFDSKRLPYQYKNFNTKK
jgi:hypothetical protein